MYLKPVSSQEDVRGRTLQNPERALLYMSVLTRSKMEGVCKKTRQRPKGLSKTFWILKLFSLRLLGCWRKVSNHRHMKLPPEPESIRALAETGGDTEVTSTWVNVVWMLPTAGRAGRMEQEAIWWLDSPQYKNKSQGKASPRSSCERWYRSTCIDGFRRVYGSSCRPGWWRCRLVVVTRSLSLSESYEPCWNPLNSSEDPEKKWFGLVTADETEGLDGWSCWWSVLTRSSKWLGVAADADTCGVDIVGLGRVFCQQSFWTQDEPHHRKQIIVLLTVQTQTGKCSTRKQVSDQQVTGK